MKIKERWTAQIKKVTIHTKLNIFAFGLVALFSILIVYLIFSLISFGNSYNQIVKNITAANAYNLNLKEEVDYAVYRMIAGKISAKDLEQELALKSPYDTLSEAKSVFKNLESITTGKGNARRLKIIIKSFDTLEKRINEINETVEKTGFYDKNMELLDINIRMLTGLMQEWIQEYIYYEAANLETVRLQLRARQSEAVTISLVMLGISMAVTVTASFAISKSIAKPIQNLCKTADLVAKGNFTTRAEESYGDEVSILTDSFNSMVSQIGDLVENIKAEQLNLRETELKLLQSQINPHFLYNTLDTIIWLAEVDKTKEVVEMVTALSEFFRNALSDGKSFIRIEEETAHIRSYLQIQHFRYRDIMEYTIDIPENLMNYSIIKLTLQPLIENALYHGIKNKRGMGKISVSGKEEAGKVIFLVEDNGIGMTEETLKYLILMLNGECREKKEGGYGLVNVQERIRLYYGEEYGLSFSSIYGEGTIAKVIIPAEEYKNAM